MGKGDIRVGVVSLEVVPGDIERNLKRTETFCLRAERAGISLLCFPEASVTGYTADPEEARTLCGGIGTRAILAALAAMASRARLTLLAGFIEETPRGALHVTHAVLGPDGAVGLYRKTHLAPPEQTGFKAGDALKVFPCPNGWTVGIGLCYEAHFPEVSTAMALMGADVLFFPHASPRGSPEEKALSWQRHLQARAFDNGVYLVACNPSGRMAKGAAFPGISLILGPDGHPLASHLSGGEALLEVTLDAGRLEAWRRGRMGYFLPHRRPELYGDLTTPPTKKTQG